MKLLNLILALLVSGLMALAVLEVGLRLIGMGPPTTLNRFDPATGWSNKRATAMWTNTPDRGKVHFSFNAHGLREGEDVTPEKPAGTTRIVVLGDSFTLGRYLAQDELFLDKLEGLYSAAGHQIQLVNTGSEGFATDQQVTWLLEHGDDWKPDVVLLMPYENDLYWCGQSTYTGINKPRFTPDGVREATKLDNTLDRGLIKDSAIGRKLFRRPGAPTFQPGSRSIPEEFGVVLDDMPAFMDDALARAEGAMKALVAKCADLGAELVVAPIPAETAIYPADKERLGKALGLGGLAWSGDNAVERVTQVSLAAGVPAERIVDMRPTFRAHDADGGALYYDKDWHLAPLGNTVLARFLGEELARLGLCPDVSATALPEEEPESAPGFAATWVSKWANWWMLVAGIWLFLSVVYAATYKEQEKPALAAVKIALLLGVVVSMIFAITVVPGWIGLAALVGILVFVAYKLGDRISTITELLKAFTLRGHWYLLPLVTILLTVGSLLVVAASSPLIAPFIYTLF
jgi:hypothetical protein